MPIYTFVCNWCGHEFEDIVSATKKDAGSECPSCGKDAKWRGPERPHLGQPAYQMKALTADGQHVAGHFGKDARRKRRPR